MGSFIRGFPQPGLRMPTHNKHLLTTSCLPGDHRPLSFPTMPPPTPTPSPKRKVHERRRNCYRYYPGCAICRRTTSPSPFLITSTDKLVIFRRFHVSLTLKGTEPGIIGRYCQKCHSEWSGAGVFIQQQTATLEEDEEDELDSGEVGLWIHRYVGQFAFQFDIF